MTEYNIETVVIKKMKIVSEVRSQQELEEMKSVMEKMITVMVL